ncbi:MAG: TetR/AcrR family transcriptional regulator [Betaproteobacteria bacterium]
MAEKKRPRRTRERILETSLALFNRHGAPHVTTAHIADEMNISPGNLYYHFANKDEIVIELFDAYEARVEPLFADPRGRHPGVDDLWLWLHLLFEQMWGYRFLYRDLDLLTSRHQALGARFGALVRKGASTVVEWCRAMVDDATMRASGREIDALAQNAMLVAAYWSAYDRIRRAAGGDAQEPDAGRAAYQVLALFGPYFTADARAHLDRLSAGYL